MSQFARVISIDILRDFKAALTEFAEQAGVALSEAQSDVQRTIFWLQHEQQAHWQREIKKRNEKLAQAKAELNKKQIATNDVRTSAVLERKMVTAAQNRLDEAEEKLRRVKKWSQLLEREFLLFKAQCQQVSGAVQADIPAAVVRMNKMISSLEAYVALQAPPSGPKATQTGLEYPSEITATIANQPMEAPPAAESSASPAGAPP